MSHRQYFVSKPGARGIQLHFVQSLHKKSISSNLFNWDLVKHWVQTIQTTKIALGSLLKLKQFKLQAVIIDVIQNKNTASLIYLTISTSLPYKNNPFILSNACYYSISTVMILVLKWGNV